MIPSQESIAIAGAGLVGSLLGVYLAQRGYRVDLYEGRPDPRIGNVYQGRSINLALSDRGWAALEKVGLAQAIRAEAIPMVERVIHGIDGSLTTQPYGEAGQAIYSVSRAGINQRLISLAEQHEQVSLHFEYRLTQVDFASGTAGFDTPAGTVQIAPQRLFGADGANSKIRRLMQELPRMNFSLETMDVAYIELNIPANADGSHQLGPIEALHIWPRDQFMLIALPNLDGSFTCTLFMDFDGPNSFASLQGAPAIQAFFETQFPDVAALLETPAQHFIERAPSPLALVDVYPWVQANRICLIGDACHAIVPFYGQGMNAGFEDCRILDELLEQMEGDWEQVLPAFQQSRKANVAAIATLAKRNYIEMSRLTGQPSFLLRKKIEAKFSRKYPKLWVPLYTMVTFRPEIPYAEALRIGDEQSAIMDEIMTIPDIEQHWDEDWVLAKLYQLACRQWGQALTFHSSHRSCSDAKADG
ncbi:NAD(P)/FAD-dependent oxidoreductase [Ferrimonas pelagia]|uniref:Kynurenine 3-monooxygenase n=1 Tax=Ferrimonas pelagia TaxID=1177826 RepID=A0ABP9EVJ0_9GAMM